MIMQIESSFSINAIILISSDPIGEEGQSRRLEEDLVHLCSNYNGLRFIHMPVKGNNDFDAKIDKILNYARNDGIKPIIHLHMHGDKEKGLQMADGSYVSWIKVANRLRKLNKLMLNNLCVISTACYGYHMVKGITIQDTTPFYGLIGAQDEISFGTIDDTATKFYSVLLESCSIDTAYNQVKDFFSYFHCEKMLAVCLARYIRQSCMGNGKEKRREDLLTIAIACGHSDSPGNLKKLRKSIREHIKPNEQTLHKYINNFLAGRTVSYTIDDLVSLVERSLADEKI